jgi:alpha-mannosidase
MCAPGRDARGAELVDCLVTSDVSLSAGSQRVEIRSEVENTARDHRLRVLFPVPYDATHADAEGVFEVTRRQASQPKPAPESAAEWAELPVDTQPQKRFVDLSNGEVGLATLNRGLPEYEVVESPRGEGCALALTLLRCVEWLSREDLSTRRGHAGPMLNTPEGQGIGRHVFEYALVPHLGSWRSEDALALRQAQEFEEPMRAVVTEQHDGPLGDVWSFVHVAPASLVVSAIKHAERGDGLVVRVYNPLPDAVQAEVILARPFTDVSRANLTEEPIGEGDASKLARILSTGVHVEVRGGQIMTLLFHIPA